MQLLNVKISERNSYFISPELVNAAMGLAKDGEQRLRPVSTREDSTFYFWLASTCNAHLAAVRVSISIVASVSRPSNPFYEPAAQICLCCSECDLTGFQKASQRIYDVYIRPIQWTLDLSVIAHPHTFAPDSACWERGQRALERLVYDSEREIRDDNTTTSKDTPSSDAHGRALHDREEAEKGQQEGTSNESDGNTTGGNEWSRSAQPKPNQKKSLSAKETEDQDKKIVRTLAKKALNQLDIIHLRASTLRRKDVTYRLEVKAIIDRYQQAQAEDRFSALDALRAHLWEGGEDHELEVKLEDNAVLAPNVVKWARKLCSSCILFMLREQRMIQATNTQRYWADGTSIIHSVLNNLFVAEGPKALGVLAALAALQTYAEAWVCPI
ncbi:hypothetical protein BN1723_003019 [Verticillium longisporum]|uniref:Uncharacterized protein n=1 Tax=Verticillium longisporum TaxID=100787 RepID=A0A0G4LMW6_VERLO|nr:hypothetical protein BN1723_003019 [Verticillium longisporum]